MCALFSSGRRRVDLFAVVFRALRFTSRFVSARREHVSHAFISLTLSISLSAFQNPSIGLISSVESYWLHGSVRREGRRLWYSEILPVIFVWKQCFLFCFVVLLEEYGISRERALHGGTRAHVNGNKLNFFFLDWPMLFRRKNMFAIHSKFLRSKMCSFS